MLPPVSCNRWYEAPPELIFCAFTEPSLLERWFCPSPEIAMRVDRCDPRPGGLYRFIFHFPDSTVVPVRGEYQVVSPPRQLIFTWTWEPPDEHAGIPTLVTVDLAAHNGGTKLSLRHEHFPGDAIRGRHESGWAATLDRLATLCHTSHEE